MKLSTALRSVLGNLGIYRRTVQHQALFLWPEVVGKALSRQSRPLRVDKGILVVLTSGPAWSQELSFMKPQLMEQLNRRIGGKEIIKDIRFLVQRSDGEEAEADTPSEPPDQLPALKSLSPAGAQWVRDLWRDLSHLPAPERRMLVLLAARKTQRDEAVRDQGWGTCRMCNVSIPPQKKRSLCSSCFLEQELLEHRLKAALNDAPWLSSDDLVRMGTDSNPEAYLRAKRELERQWRTQLSREASDEAFSSLAGNLVMLLTGKPATLLDTEDFGRVLPRHQARRAIAIIMGRSAPGNKGGQP